MRLVPSVVAATLGMLIAVGGYTFIYARGYARQGQLALRGATVPGLQTSEAVKPLATTAPERR